MGHNSRAGDRLTQQMRIGILAGEVSGDNLGAGLMRAMRELSPGLQFLGVGGPAMTAEGLQSLASIEALAVNGFRDPIIHLPRLWRLLKTLESAMADGSIDVFVGVDFNVFNFLLEARLKKRGIRTVHYVSPSVYAWRRGRTRRLARIADVILCLFPFEPEFYAGLDIQAVFVGHPLADEIDFAQSSERAKRRAREQLEFPDGVTVIALLPGSRRSEISLMLPVFQQAAAQIQERMEMRGRKVLFVLPCVRPELRDYIDDLLLDGPEIDCRVYTGNARRGLVACDAALVKSGTSTLEAMLLHRPMVVSYKLGALSYQLAKRLMKSPYVALPNILAGDMLVPELLQNDATPSALADALLKELDASESDADYLRAFTDIHNVLQRQADATAANAVLHLLGVGSR